MGRRPDQRRLAARLRPQEASARRALHPLGLDADAGYDVTVADNAVTVTPASSLTADSGGVLTIAT